MELKVLKKTDTEIIIEIIGEDDTLGNLIAKEAMKHPKVVYASYRIPHPLQNRLEIIINVEPGANISEVLLEITENIRKFLREFKKEVEEKL
ncbi:RNA polymerase, dimerisation [Staphylothermus marinus F1]|uniref:DNA-directed RNA polymerase subunit Rpo11 n=1 Tax=Staphylothermus marinus (strain ATCC 43588 / DSM 3639 / JCM 9404 / F1) TaxID=399550 RepID=A3DM82_STAMF|nr:DNA-directed RNA polymerase subunit L [Staphylothermus marinus]ABN69742.1 RNA polymerase, dimerisation [Staphylothermus marinus F1]